MDIRVNDRVRDLHYDREGYVNQIIGTVAWVRWTYGSTSSVGVNRIEKVGR